METVVWIVLGLIAGVIAMVIVFRTIPRTPWSWTGALLAGLAGGWLGGLVTEVVGLEAVNWLGAFIISLIGTTLLLFLVRRLLPGRA
jgi:uncharacterized membrane protein YeaQ/YmgE (transglycosylase-associated protein family)